MTSQEKIGKVTEYVIGIVYNKDKTQKKSIENYKIAKLLWGTMNHE